MAYNHEYPYTDPNRYNDDWLIKQVKDMQSIVDALNERYASLAKLLDEANAYTDSKVASLKTVVDANKSDIASLKASLDSTAAQLEALIYDTASDLETDIDTKYTRTTQMIHQQWNDMVEYISQQFIDVKVRNFFTGLEVSIQSMFDYLALLHLQDAGTYAQVSNINTYQHYVDKNKSYTEVLTTSRTFFNS